ncbi:MAG TPA: hypothetical protein VFT27_10935, partial [Actinomycetota bacterium]|nr:hypothetical protein [Actinomycetota bacterium]
MRVRIVRMLLVLTATATWLVAVGAPPASGLVPPPTLIQIIDTSSFSPPSPDPSGLAVKPNGKLLMSDGEVDETPIFAGKN